ncbi:hypothetical protein SBD_4221 [Streptomyces bottropensis ATCC 25435]|uniref:Uncharacterized protein n=1 Tax=Streptomyces bottropensis ATCC 25435 TaxID=1054862 RepID=M3FQZ3_9ACTN|nr:hypothetical protein SBD_4221 [Streptomyces bottropensis ATCC 25435]
MVTDHGPRSLVESCSPRDGVPLATPHPSRPSPALPASCHRPHRASTGVRGPRHEGDAGRSGVRTSSAPPAR